MKAVTVLIFIISSALSMPNKSLDPRIIQGEEAARNQIPYILSIQNFGSHNCGAAIISPTFAVSAAHCFYRGQSYLVAVAGSIDLDENHPDNQRIEVAEVIPHPNYDGNYNDILLLRLAAPVNYTSAVQPVGIPEPEEPVVGDVVVSGWGRVSVIPSVYPTKLQYLKTSAITVDECNKRFKETNAYPHAIIDTEVCTLASGDNQSACHGDSGGPLVQNGKLVGVVHGGNPSCGALQTEPLPNVFTRVSAFVDFIKQHVTDL